MNRASRYLFDGIMEINLSVHFWSNLQERLLRLKSLSLLVFLVLKKSYFIHFHAVTEKVYKIMCSPQCMYANSDGVIHTAFRFHYRPWKSTLYLSLRREAFAWRSSWPLDSDLAAYVSMQCDTWSRCFVWCGTSLTPRCQICGTSDLL